MSLPRISVVIPYQDRPEYLDLSLRGILSSAVAAELEILVVDDGSRVPLLPAPEPTLLGHPSVQVLRVNPAKKRHVNPCVANNIGINAARGEVVVFQAGPELLGVGDPLAEMGAGPPEDQFWSFGVLSVDPENSRRILAGTAGLRGEDLRRAVAGFAGLAKDARGARRDFELAWYNHPGHRAWGGYLFSACRREVYLDLGGFDLRYANASMFDDNELKARLNRSGRHVEVLATPWCFHLAHEAAKRPDTNARLFFEVTSSERDWTANGRELLPGKYKDLLE